MFDWIQQRPELCITFLLHDIESHQAGVSTDECPDCEIKQMIAQLPFEKLQDILHHFAAHTVPLRLQSFGRNYSLNPTRTNFTACLILCVNTIFQSYG